MRAIPSHIRYPAMIFGLLGLTLVVNIILVTATRSDGGAQVVDDYYQESIAWDERAEVRDFSAALGWTLNVEMQPDEPGRLQILRPDEQGVPGLVGKVRLRRPQLADDVAVAELRPVEGSPGLYEFDHPVSKQGLWDVILEGEFAGRPVAFEQRQRVR